MQNKTHLTCTEASELMGVSRSTVQRYCDQGVLKLHRTVGGHRRLKAEDVIAWVRSARSSRRRPRSKPFSADKYSAAYVADALLAGRLRRLDPLLEEVIAGRMGRARLFDEFVAPAMWEVGYRWQAEQISYAEERIATSNLKRLLSELNRSAAPNPSGLTAVGGVLEGDYAEIGSMMVESILQEQGYNAFHVGSNIPAQCMADMAHQSEARLVWTTYCHIDDESRIVRQNHELRELLGDGVVLAVGGGGLTPALLGQLCYDFHSQTMAEFSQYVACYQHAAA